MLTECDNQCNSHSGFVSIKLFRIILLIGLVALSLSILINYFISNPIMIAVDVVMSFFFVSILILINKFPLNFSMRIAMLTATFGIVTILLFDSRGVVWVALIPLVAYALFGEKEGSLWTLGGLIVICSALSIDAMTLLPIYSLVEVINIQLGYIVLSLIAWFFVRHVESSHQTILMHATERERLEVAHNISGGIAHLINNEMQAIVLKTGLLRMNVRDESTIHTLESINDISYKASDHANQLLAYSHYRKHCAQAFDLRNIIIDLSNGWKRDLPNGISIGLNMPSSLPHCYGDPKLIQKLLTGLVTNAKEACNQDGEIELSIEPEYIEKAFLSPDMKAGNYLRLEISDNGCGIEQQALPKIFEPFYSCKFTGRGLGLSAIYGIAKSHGGHISVKSTIGKGSRFTVYLPIAPNDQPASRGSR